MIDSWITQLRKGILELCVLNHLLQGESYGYEIVQDLNEIAGIICTESTVYPILSRLRKENYLKVKAVPSSSGPPRRYFHLTPLGSQRVESMNQHWRELIRSIESLQNNQPKGE